VGRRNVAQASTSCVTPAAPADFGAADNKVTAELRKLGAVKALAAEAAGPAS
jgi:hypothetical protein